MGIVSPSQSNSGDTIEASDINNPINQLTAVINGNIDATNLADNGVSAIKIADSAVTPAKLQTGTGGSWAWQSWTPTWTNLTVGNGTLDYAKYVQVGKKVTVRLKFTLGSTSSVTGTVKASLPVTAASYGASVFQSIGSGMYLDFSANAYCPLGVLMDSTSTFTLHLFQSATTFATVFYLDNVNPAAPAVSDFIQCTFTYEAA